MSLKISLKPHERLIIAGAVIINGNTTANLIVENNVPILRKKDIMREADAASPARRIYFVVQMMYLDLENRVSYQGKYSDLVRDFLKAAPSSRLIIDEINEDVMEERYYPALKAAAKLIKLEEEILSSAIRTNVDSH
jgi:flagellar biosynthesis repressor protein FlbT